MKNMYLALAGSIPYEANVGIGITTFNRNNHLELIKNQIQKYHNNKKYNFKAYIADDSKDRKGIAYRKNECLRALKDCDYIFLFDDDTFPIKDGWVEWFIMNSRRYNQKHFQYLKETPTIKRIGNKNYWDDMNNGNLGIYNNTAGCFMFMTKECIDKVGAYDERFGIYGFEHAQYTNRIHKAGLTPLGSYTCPAGAGEYIYAMDLDNHLPFNKELNHKSSIEIKEALVSIERNKAIYLQDTEIHIPL